MTAHQTPPVRSQENMDDICQLWGEPIIVDDFFTPGELDFIKKEVKRLPVDHGAGRGNFYVDLRYFDNDVLADLIVAKLVLHCNLPEMQSAKISDINHFTLVGQPYNIHSDSGQDPEAIPYKNITIWLDSDPEVANPGGLVLFRQHSFYSVSLTRTYEDHENFVANEKTKSDFVIDLNTEAEVDEAVWQKYLSHVPRECLNGMEIEDIIDYRENRCVVFDSCQIHSSAFFKPFGWKTGIMISFTLET